jgi:probable HAF family extracellular repeat protein
MKITHRVKARLVAGAALCAGLGVATQATALERHYFVDLDSGTVRELEHLGDRYPKSSGINNAGQVVGYLETDSGAGSRHAFITGPNGRGMFDLGEMFEVELPEGRFRDSYAYGINDDGKVVGYTWNPGPEAFITGPNGLDYRDLGGRYSVASGINTAGQAVGFVDHPGQAFITGPDGKGATELGTLGGLESAASDINDIGQVVGSSTTTAEAAYHAFITGADGEGMRDLGTLGGLDSYASAINNAGQVVGSSRFTGEEFSGPYHAFITGPDGTGMRDLGTFGGIDSYSYASGINDDGQVVGYSSTASGANHAFITGPAGNDLVDLNSLLDLPDEVTLTEAVDINNAGQVVAVAQVIPEPETYAMLLAGLGVIGFMARRKKAAIPGRTAARLLIV